MNPPNFFAELKRRNVVRAAGLYLVGAWLIVQVAGTVLPMFGAPDWLPRTIVILLAIGFVPMLIFSWVFELTPQGLKRDEEVAPGQSIAPQTGRRMDRMIIAVLVAALGYFAFDKFVVAPRRAPALGGKETAAQPRQLSAAGPTIDAKSIAVLPFENLSDEKSNAYFAEGIQDEILTRLSKIGALKVISRTSTQKYKSAPDNLRDVGSQLGVANILEGSVQKIANAAHINVQLIRAATDEHLWAESYNRKLDDVFSVEGEVATTIAAQLDAKLTGAEHEALAQKPTENAAAYDAYLRALSIEHHRYGYDAYVAAAAEYARAVELDPNFALAWARLAVLRSFLYFNGIDLTANSAAKVKGAADKASALQPDLAEAWVGQGAYRYRVQRDFAGALQAYHEALKRLPNSALVYEYMAYVERRLGRWTEAEPHYQKALELDPENLALLASEAGEFLLYLRRFDEAQAALDRALQISPGDPDALVGKAGLFQQQGRLEEAAATLARIPAEDMEDFVFGGRVTQAVYERHFDAAIRLVEQKLKTVPAGQALDSVTVGGLVTMGYCQQWLGQHEEARRSFSRAVQAIKPTPETVVTPEANGLPSILALAYAGLGEKEEALQQAQQAVKDYETDAVAKPAAQVTLAQIQGQFGDHDAAIAALPQLLQIPAGLNVANLKLDPFWDPMRKDPRFQKLIADGEAAPASDRTKP